MVEGRADGIRHQNSQKAGGYRENFLCSGLILRLPHDPVTHPDGAEYDADVEEERGNAAFARHLRPRIMSTERRGMGAVRQIVEVQGVRESSRARAEKGMRQCESDA